MEYKPPVKSSLRKFYDRRLSSLSRSPPSSASSSSPDHLHQQRSSSSKSAAGSAYVQTVPASFEQRMRAVIFGAERARPPAVEKHSLPSPPNLITVESLQEYRHVVGDETERIVAVRFYATFCRACKAVTLPYHKLAWAFPNVVFVDVPVTEKNAALHQGLGVPSLPYAHIYHPQAGLVEETKLLRKDVSHFRDVLQTYLQGYCPFLVDTQEEEEVMS